MFLTNNFFHLNICNDTAVSEVFAHKKANSAAGVSYTAARQSKHIYHEESVHGTGFNMAENEEKKGDEKKEKGVAGTTADVGKGAAKGTVDGTKKIGGSIGKGIKNLGKKDEK